MNHQQSIIAGVEHLHIGQNPVALIDFNTGVVVALQEGSLACYRNRSSLTDPLGNGLLSVTEIAKPNGIAFEQGLCVIDYRAGYVGLVDGKALLIVPGAIRLYPSKLDALQGSNCLAELELPELSVD